MPIKPKKPCAKPGCPNLTDGRYCEEHQEEAEKRKAESNRFYDKHVRDKQAEAFYKSKAWVAARRRALMRDNYLCQECLRNGRPTPLGVKPYDHAVDHITPKVKGGTDDPDNLQSLCAPCHDAKSEREAKEGQGAKTKPRYDADGFPVWE